MNLFESLQLITETSTFESKVDYDLLKQNDIDFFENGAGVYRLTTPNGETVDVNIELSNSATDIPKYFVSIPGDDIKTVSVDLTAALLDAANKLNDGSSPFDKIKRVPKKVTESSDDDIEAGWLDLSKNLKDINNGKYKPSHLLHLLDSETLKLDITKLIEYDEDEHDCELFNGKYFANWDDYIESIENIKTESNCSECECEEDNIEESAKLEKLSIGNKLQTVFDNFNSNIKLVGFMLKYIDEDIIEKMYNDIVGVEEATSGIGGAYTTKAIDILPSTLNVRDKKYKTESVFKMWDEEFDEDKIAKDIKHTKENKDSQFALMTVKYQDEDIYLVNDGEFSLIDDKDCLLYLGYNENMDKFLVYFEIKNIEVTSYPEDGPDADDFNYELNEIPYKITRI